MQALVDFTHPVIGGACLKSEEPVPENRGYALGHIGHNARDKVSDWGVGRGILHEIRPP